MSWLHTELSQHRNQYILLTVGGLLFFILIGYFTEKETSDILKHAAKVKDTNLELTQLATTDGLTKLFNARYIHERLEIEMENSYRSALSCLLVDIDYFKKINDQYGHPVGDDVLVHVANSLKKSVRKVDLVGRLGGEEFLILLPNTPAHLALMVAERIRSTIESGSIEVDSQSIHISCSLGVLTYPAEGLTNKQSILKAADEALYLAKNSGRNRAVVWTVPQS